MYTTEDKIFNLTNELVVSVEEDFYFLDIDFDSTNCNIIFQEIAKLFLEKDQLNLFRKEAILFIKECLREVDKNGENNYTLFFDNLNILLELDFIELEDIEKLKIRIMNKCAIENKDKKLALTNIS